MNVLVTGASGFLGAEVIRETLRVGMQPVALLRPGRKLAGDLNRVPYRVGDITRPETLAAAVEGCEAVCHCAAIAHLAGMRSSYLDFEKTNLEGAQNLFLAAREAGIRRFVQVSTVAVYGSHASDLIDERQRCAPLTPYAVTKYAAEMRLSQLAADSGVDLVILRMATIIGEGDPGNLERLIDAIVSAPFTLIPAGPVRKSFVYKMDAARACVKALRSKVSGVEIANISTPPALLSDVVEHIARSAGRRSFPVPVQLIALSRTLLGLLSKYSRHAAKTHRTLDRLLTDEQFSFARAVGLFEWEPEFNWREALEAQMRRTR